MVLVGHSQTEAQVGIYESNEERGITGRPESTSTQRCVCRLSCRSVILRCLLFGCVPNGVSTIRVADNLTMNQVVTILPSHLVIQNNQSFKRTDNRFLLRTEESR